MSRTQQQAEEEGKALCARMRGKGWVLRVWESTGWRYSVHAANLSVYPNSEGDRYYCSMSNRTEDGPPGMCDRFGSAPVASTDPNEAVRATVEQAGRAVEKLMRGVEYAESVTRQAVL